VNGWPFGPRSDHEYDCDRTLKQCRCFVLQEPGVGAKLCPQIKNDVYQFDFSREVDFSGIPSGCLYKDDSVPGVSASLQPPATVCDRFVIKMNCVSCTCWYHHEVTTSTLAISATVSVTSVAWRPCTEGGAAILEGRAEFAMNSIHNRRSQPL